MAEEFKQSWQIPRETFSFQEGVQAPLLYFCFRNVTIECRRESRRAAPGGLDAPSPCRLHAYSPPGEDGIVAIRAMEGSAWGYDLLLLDIMLPGTDGYAVFRQVKSSGILKTAEKFEKNLQQANSCWRWRKGGGKEYFYSKPPPLLWAFALPLSDSGFDF